MMDCKKALTETDGNMDKAIDLLREKESQRLPKADRIAAEGLTLIKTDGNTGVILEVNSETDFVAKNEGFKELLNDLADHILAEKPESVEAAMGQKMANGSTVEEYITSAVAKIGEKSRFAASLS